MHEDRLVLHDSIVDAFASHVPSVGSDLAPVAVLMMGGVASGKSSARKALLQERDFVEVNPDAVREHLPEYSMAIHAGTTGTGHPISAKNAAEITHNESLHVARMILHHAIEHRKSILIDSTGRVRSSYEAKITQLRHAGYRVVLVLTDVDREEARARSINRANATGRMVPKAVFESSHDMAPRNFRKLIGLADSAMVVSTHGNPKIVASWNDGVRQIYDIDAHAEYDARSQ